MTNLKRLLVVFGFMSFGLSSAAFAETEPSEKPEEAKEQQAEEPVDRATETSKRLEELLRRAADSGYVTLKSDKEPAAEEASAGSAADPSATAGPTQLVTTPPVSQPVVAVEVDPFSCDNASVFDFEFAQTQVSYDDIFDLRSKLVGSNRGYDEETGLQLAKTYLALALSEEALATTRILKSERARLANMMGRVLLDNPDDASAVLEPYMACSESAAPWVAMSFMGLDPDKALSYADDNTLMIKDLPTDLQLYFATQLGILAVEQGNNILAGKLLRIAELADDDQDTAVLYLKSQIDLNAGLEEGISALRQIAQVQGPMQPKALITLGEISEKKPYRDYDTDLDLISVQYNGLNESDLAKLMNIRFLAENGKYQRAIDESKNSLIAESESALKARDSVASILINHLNKSELLVRQKALYSYSANISFFLGFAEENVLRLAAVNVALESELPQLVSLISREFDFADLQREIDLILVKAAMQEQDAARALTLTVLHRGDPEFDRIAVDAAILREDAALALSILSDMPETEEVIQKRAETAWHFGMWESARDYYADLLLSSDTPENAKRHRLAAYMSGEEGGFFSLPALEEFSEVDNILESYEKEKDLLKEYLTNG